MKAVILKKGRDESLKRHHPWVFSGAISKTKDSPALGETVDIMSYDGAFLGKGAYSPESQIAVRVWSFNKAKEINSSFFKTRIEIAISFRKSITDVSSAYRLVNSESDGLPGLIIDKYNNILVCQFLSAGTEYFKTEIINQLKIIFPDSIIYERSDTDAREKEGLEKKTGLIFGKEIPDLIEITEGQCKFYIDIKNGHKTGFYLDQRENRIFISEFCKEKEILNCFSYTGGFAIHALKNKAKKVINIESSEVLLDITKKNIQLNNIDMTKTENVAADVFKMLRTYRDSGRTFDVIILDPPKFAESKSQLNNASRGYKDINLLAFKLLKPGGILFTFSCSGLITIDLFNKIVAGAAADSKRDAKIIFRLTQSADHPTALNFPEGAYLKGLACKASEADI